MFDRRLYFHLDWLLLAAILVLSVMGIAMIYSATQATTPRLYQQQVYALVLGLVALTVALSIDYRTLADKSHWIYIGIVLLLIYVMFFGVVRGGARRWIPLGVFNLQPSEFAKIAVALVLAKFYGESRRQSPTRADLVTGAAMTALPFLLVARQPDRAWFHARRRKPFRRSDVPRWRSVSGERNAHPGRQCGDWRSEGDSRRAARRDRHARLLLSRPHAVFRGRFHCAAQRRRLAEHRFRQRVAG